MISNPKPSEGSQITDINTDKDTSHVHPDAGKCYKHWFVNRIGSNRLPRYCKNCGVDES